MSHKAMEAPAEFNDLTTIMRIPGIHGAEELFCVHPNKTIAYLIDSKHCIIMVDLLTGKRISELKIGKFQLIKNKFLFKDIRFATLESTDLLNSGPTEKTGDVLLAAVLECDTNKHFLVAFELKTEESVAVSLEEYCIIDFKNISEITENNGYLINDENGELYYVICYDNEERLETTFHVVKLKLDHSQKVSQEIIMCNRIIDGLYLEPFIFRNDMTFIPLDTELEETISFDLKRFTEKRCYTTVSDDHEEQSLPEGDYSNSYRYGSRVYFYVFTEERKTGEVWTFALNTKTWQKCFELISHPINEPFAFFVTPDGKLFLHGDCADANCLDKAHLYRFGFPWFKNMIYLTIEQLGAVFSTAKTQIYFGPKNSGKSFVLLIKILNAIGKDPAYNRTKIFLSSIEQIDYFIHIISSFFGSSSMTNNILLQTEADFQEQDYDSCDIFVAKLLPLSFKEKQFLWNRSGNTFITIDQDPTLTIGFDHPRAASISWIRFDSIKGTSNLFVDNQQTLMQNTKNSVKPLVEQSMAAMDQLYGDWWSCSSKRTIFIPACHDVIPNRYLLPTDEGAAAFNHKLGNKNKSDYRGQKAENDFFQLFQKLEIGGLFISGFNSIKFAKSQIFFKKFKFGIGEWEIDAIFIHPLCGIFVFEIKATEKEEHTKVVIRKAINQLKKVEHQLPVICNKICNAQVTIPLHCVICFPNTSVCAASLPKENYFLFEKSSVNDESKIKSFILSKMIFRPQDEMTFDSVKKIAAAVAGYRSMDFISPGHNALAVLKMINTQCDLQENSTVSQDGIFLTNEQLFVLNCHDRHQIISGPPGTGKTIILLKKALAAAQTEKNGSVQVIAQLPELVLRFQRFFERHIDSIVRYPVISGIYESLSDFEDEDDIFIDEENTLVLRVSELQERLHKIGQTVIVLTGLFNPLQVIDASDYLNANNLNKFRHLPMKTVIRSSKKIYDEWRNEYNENNYPLLLGHNITGPNVQRAMLKNSNEILIRILEYIRALFPTHENFATKNKISLNNLCIITDREESCTLISSFLASHGIPCGSIKGQFLYRNIVAVAKYDKTVSLEWAFVIAVSMIDISFPRPFFLIAASRAIAKLMIIERDFLGFVKKIDQQIQPTTEPCYSEFQTAVIHAEKENDETETFVMSYDFPFLTIRWNFIFSELRERKSFKDCYSLFDCWKRIADQPSICSALLNEHENLMDLFDNGTVSISNEPSRLFLRITSDHLNATEQKANWEILKQVGRALTAVWEKERDADEAEEPIEPNAADAEETRRISEDLNKSAPAWKLLQNTIRHLLV